MFCFALFRFPPGLLSNAPPHFFCLSFAYSIKYKTNVDGFSDHGTISCSHFKPFKVIPMSYWFEIVEKQNQSQCKREASRSAGYQLFRNSPKNAPSYYKDNIGFFHKFFTKHCCSYPTGDVSESRFASCCRWPGSCRFVLSKCADNPVTKTVNCF